MRRITRKFRRAAAQCGEALLSWTRFRNRIELSIEDAHNAQWQTTHRGKRLTFVRNPLLKSEYKIFTMGSCFAREVRAHLIRRGFDVYPKYTEISFNREIQKLSLVPEWDHLNHYNTFTIRQEFELAFSQGHYDPRDFIRHAQYRRAKPLKGEVWQDPYRKLVYANSEGAIVDLSQKIDACLRNAILDSDVYIITLGLTEVWRNNESGLYLNQEPDPIDTQRFTFERSSYEQNYANMAAVCSMLGERFPDRKIIVTVSPVALARTFSDMDVIVANNESKSTLRAVAAALSRNFSNVIYWPSYEIALMTDLYEEDGRNVRPGGVRLILDQFLAVHASR